MKVNTESAEEGILPVTTAGDEEAYRIERHYEGERSASQVVSALMKVHDRKESV